MQAAEPKQVRVVTPVNPAPGIGRGSAGIPRAAESCQVIHPPPVPSTPAKESASAGPHPRTLFFAGLFLYLWCSG